MNETVNQTDILLLPVHIETERLVIRESLMDECEMLQELNEASDYIEKWVGWKTPNDYTIRAITEGNLPPGGKRELFSIKTIFTKNSRQMIGTIELYHGYPCKDALCIGWLFIHPNYQNCGYAREVMCAIEKDAAKAGYARLRLGIHLKNWPALRTWLRLGFDKLINIVGDEIYDEKANATMILEKPLLQ